MMMMLLAAVPRRVRNSYFSFEGMGAVGAPRQQGGPGPGAELAEPAPCGRPRSVKAHAAILKAAAGLLLEYGLDAVSMDAVAARADVGKATIYRWWPTKEIIAFDALHTEWAAIDLAGIKPAPGG
jgi:hypothetical protein